jgi:hypothetical protein
MRDGENKATDQDQHRARQTVIRDNPATERGGCLLDDPDIAANAHAPAFNCVVTNVPGSRVPLYFCGARMVAMYGTGPVFDGMGLINPVYS